MSKLSCAERLELAQLLLERYLITGEEAMVVLNGTAAVKILDFPGFADWLAKNPLPFGVDRNPDLLAGPPAGGAGEQRSPAPSPTRCECGGEKAGTTHSAWCPVKGE